LGFLLPVNTIMGFNIRCYTLFDITKTNITNRNPPSTFKVEVSAWHNKRNSQVNFDTLLQVISLRAQPESVTDPIHIVESPKGKFGFFTDLYEECDLWYFDFYVNHQGVFSNNESELGALYEDCDSVPMIKTGNIELPGFLDISPELRNIYFEIINYV